MDKSLETAITGAGHGTHGSISDDDSILLRTEKQGDPFPASGDAVAVQEEDKAYPPTSKAVLIVLSLAASMFLVALVCIPISVNRWAQKLTLPRIKIIATAIPTITDEFDSLGDVGWYASAFMLTASAPMLLFGKMYTFYSPKWLLVGVMGLFELGSLVCATAPNSIAFILGRAIAGLGSAGIFTGCIVGVQHVIPLQKRPMVIGMFGGVFGIASVAGPLLGGALTDRSSWRWCFYINLPIGGVAMAALAIVLQMPAPAAAETSLKKKLWQLDPLGTVCFLPGICCVLLALQWGGNKYSWNDGRIIALFIIGGVLVITFVGIQIWLQDDATVPPRIIKQRSIAAGFSFSLCIGGSMIVSILYLAIYFQAVKGTSAVQSGIDTMPLLLSMALGAVVGGATVSRIGYYAPFMIAGTPIMAAGAGLLSMLRPETAESRWIGYQIVFGFGTGLCMQQPSVAAQTILSDKDIAIGSSLMMFAQQLSGAVFAPIAQCIFQNRLMDTLAGVPGIDVRKIGSVGATELKSVVSPDQLEGVLAAFNHALIATFYLVTAICCVAIFPALAIEWRNVKEKKKGGARGEEGTMGDKQGPQV